MKKKTSKRSTPRNKAKYPGLMPQYNPRNRRELLDMDYLDKLSPKELKWLNKFMEEYNGAKLDFKNLSKNLHRNKRLKKDCTDRVNARNRDAYSYTKLSGKLVHTDFDREDIDVADLNHTEDNIIKNIDGDENT